MQATFKCLDLTALFFVYHHLQNIQITLEFQVQGHEVKVTTDKKTAYRIVIPPDTV